jgi:hypothetical protein
MRINFFKTIRNILLLLAGCAALTTPANAQNYFQQKVSYAIHVTLNDRNHTLHGVDTFRYVNNSPDTLAFLYIHLWPNAYKNNNTALAKQLLESKNTFMYYAPDSCFGYIDSLKFTSENLSLKWEYDPKNIDICKLFLEKPLKPGDSATISTPFFVKIPDSRISRLGHEGQSYQISQWYPKPAVYDSNGWNNMPFLNQGEFYSEYGNFEVYITLPANYVVGATGDLTGNPEEENRLAQKADETKQIKTFNKNDLAFPPSAKEFKTLHYSQKNIHDFAWFADKRYHVLNGKVALPESKRVVDTWIMFTNRNASQWKNALNYVNDAINYYSLWNGEYPYNQATAVEGALSAGGGMEYPNITVISSAGDSLDLEMVVMHEVGHNWFYGILGSNERENPWMDEGINSFYEYRYLQTKYPGSTLFVGKLGKFIKLPLHTERIERELTYQITARTKDDQAETLPAALYTPMNYGGIVYEKVSITFYSLMEYLGASEFDRIMKIYFETWKFKHPQPKDLEAIFKNNCNKDLTWFFEDLLGSTKTIDYSLLGFSKVGKDSTTSIQLKIINKGSIAAPFELCFYNNHKKISSQWYDGFTGKQKLTLGIADFDEIKINPDNNFPELTRKNNSLHKGIFKRIEPLRIQPLMNLEDPDHTQLFYLPAIGYNKYNGFMAGIALYNGFLPAKKFQYHFIPMYATGNSELTGISHIDYSFYFRNTFIHKLNLFANASKFAYSKSPETMNFYNYSSGFEMDLQRKNPQSSILKSFVYSFNYILKDKLRYKYLGNEYIPEIVNENYWVNQLRFELADSRAINPYSIELAAEQNNAFLKCYGTFNQKINYGKPRKYLNIRVFAGDFLYSTSTSNDYRFRLSGNNGTKDYLYSSYFMGRSEGSGFYSQQFTETDGGFKTQTSLGQTWNWMFALNLKTTIPGVLPVKLFADFGTYKGAKDYIPGAQAILMDAGIQLSLINNVLDIYFPLLYSKDIKTNYENNKLTTFIQKIRFTLCLEKLNPFILVKSIR